MSSGPQTPVPARPVRLTVDGAVLDGDLAVPPSPRAVVVFAHGSGSNRHSSRNRFVAAGLHRAGFATLLMDLLTPAEEEVDLRTRQHRFDVPLLAARVVAAVDVLPQLPGTAGLPIAAFGASTGAAAALCAAAARPDRVRAVVSRGGRPDLAGPDLLRVRAPTLLVVGGEDREVLVLNRRAADQLGGGAEIRVVRGATHLFEEPGALDQVVALSVGWLDRWLPRGQGVPAPT